MSNRPQHAPSEIYTIPWYPNEYPSEHEAVVVKLTKTDEMGVWVTLLEYGSKEGMIPLGLYTTRRTRRIPKNVKVGKVDVALVSLVDAEKGNMDLTRQSLKEEDIEKAKKRYSDYKNLMSLLLFVADKTKDVSFEELVHAVAYPLHEQYGNAYQALQMSFHDNTIIEKLEVSDNVKEILKHEVQKMFTPQPVRIHCVFEAQVRAFSGVEALRAALAAGYEAAPEDCDLKVTVIAPPEYSAFCVTLNETKGLEIMNAVVEKIQERVTAAKGTFTIKEKPKVMNQADQEKLNKQLSELAAGNEEVDMDELED